MEYDMHLADLNQNQKDLKEADRIGTALWKDSVPEKYKQYKIIGQGATSVVLDYSADSVLILTRDSMKKDWLVHELDFDFIESLDIPHKKSRVLGEMPVYVIKAPKLFPLSASNKRAIKHAIDEYDRIVTHKRFGFTRNYTQFETLLHNYLKQKPDSIFAQLINFLTNYDTSSYHTDFLMRNFMQDAHGKIVLIDPIVDAELVSELHKLRKYASY